MCNRAYSDKSSPQKYELIHRGEHPYSCEVCNKAFSQQSSLIRHQQGVQISECAYN